MAALPRIGASRSGHSGLEARRRALSVWFYLRESCLATRFADAGDTRSYEASHSQSITVRRQRREYQLGFGRSITQIVEKQYAAMRLEITMDQDTDVLVLGENDPPFGNGFSKQSPVARICRSLTQIDDIVAGSPHCAHGRRHNVGIGEEAHAIWRRS